MGKVVRLIVLALAITVAMASAAMAAETAIKDDSNKYSRVLEEATDEEVDELCRILYLECRGEPFSGKVACVETIFNRVLSEDWPDTIHEVLSQAGQFATYRRIDRAYEIKESNSEVAQAEICRAIMQVYENGLTVLPNEHYVYFDTRGINGKSHIKVGNQYFGAGR